MSEDLRSILSQSHWEVTKGHLRAAVAMRSGMRATNPPQTTAEDKQRSAEWLRFQEMTEKFISDVESEGWHE